MSIGCISHYFGRFASADWSSVKFYDVLLCNKRPNFQSPLSSINIYIFNPFFLYYTCIYVFHHRWQCGKTSVWWSCSTGKYGVMLHQLESFSAGVKWIIKLFQFIQFSGYVLVCLEYSVYSISIRLVCWDYLSFPLCYYGVCAVTTYFHQMPKDSRLLDCIK